jgi:NADPH2:quinone reductase
MRAWEADRHGEPAAVLRLVEKEPPAPGPGQIRLRVRATGIGLPDVLMCRGTYPMTPSLPFTPGQEVVGEVTGVGAGVDLALGMRVMATTLFPTGFGGFAEETLASGDGAYPAPPGLSDADAAGFWIPHFTAWVGLVNRAQVRAGEWLAVLGAAGGSGSAAVQVGRALGARVIAVAGGDEKLHYCRELGAEFVVDHRVGPVKDALREITGGNNVHVIYDPVGGAAAADAMRAIASEGRFLVIGFASGEWPVLDARRLLGRNFSAVGVFPSAYDRDAFDEIYNGLCGLVARGELRSTVDEIVPFDELPTALERLASREILGKLVLGPA